MIYKTTEDFLRVFGMSSLGDLPVVEGVPAVDPDSDVDTLPMEGMEFTESTDSSDEADVSSDNSES